MNPTQPLARPDANAAQDILGVPTPTAAAARSHCSAPIILAQPALDALDACEVIDGDLNIAFFDADLRPLHALTSVRGSVYLSGRLDVTPIAGIASLEGLENLETIAGSLYIDGATVSSLEPLRSLRRVGRIADAGYVDGEIHLYNMPYLVDLSGLGQLELDRVILDLLNDASVESLRPLVFPPHMLGRLLVRLNPRLLDLGDFTAVEDIEYLQVSQTALTTLDALSSLRRTTIVEIGDNPLLRDLQGIAGLEAVEFLSITANPLATELPDFPSLVRAGYLELSGNARLARIGRFPKLTQLAGAWSGQLLVRDNPVLETLSGFASLERADRVVVRGNPSLVSLDLGALQEVRQALVVTSNAQLQPATLAGLSSVSAASIKFAGNGASPALLDPCPWIRDSFCDAPPEDTLCAAGTDTEDCPIPL